MNQWIDEADAYAAMPDWMQKWADSAENGDLERISNWSEKNQKIWKDYWAIVESGKQTTKSVISDAKEVNEELKEQDENTVNASKSMNRLARIATFAGSIAFLGNLSVNQLIKGVVASFV